MPKKNRANGYVATKTRNTPNSIGRMPASAMSRNVPTSPGTAAMITSIRANRLRPMRPSMSRPKNQKMASVMTVHRSGSL